jgi:hypothetical protein
MLCYTVWLENRQLRVFPFDPFKTGDESRAFNLARQMRDAIPTSSIEFFGFSGVGQLIKD